MYLNVRYRVNVASLVIVVEAVFVVCVTLDGDVGRGCCQSRGRGRVRGLWTPFTTRWQRMRLQIKQIKNSLKSTYQNFKKGKKSCQNAATKTQKKKNRSLTWGRVKGLWTPLAMQWQRMRLQSKLEVKFKKEKQVLNVRTNSRTLNAHNRGCACKSLKQIKLVKPKQQRTNKWPKFG